MGLSKTEGFTRDQLDLAALAKALGHPARIAILQFLATHKTCICGDIVGDLPLSQSTVSQHLKELKDVGLIQGNINGQAVCYCINEKAWNRAKKVMGDFFLSFDGNNCCWSYFPLVKAAGFKNVSIQKEKDTPLPEEILNQYLSAEEVAAAKDKGVRIASITLYAEKPVASSCCGPECCNS